MKSLVIACSILCYSTYVFADTSPTANAIKNTNLLEARKAILTADQTCKRLHGNMASWNVALKKCQCSNGSYMLGVGINSPCLPTPQ